MSNVTQFQMSYYTFPDFISWGQILSLGTNFQIDKVIFAKLGIWVHKGFTWMMSVFFSSVTHFSWKFLFLPYLFKALAESVFY